MKKFFLLLSIVLQIFMGTSCLVAMNWDEEPLNEKKSLCFYAMLTGQGSEPDDVIKKNDNNSQKFESQNFGYDSDAEKKEMLYDLLNACNDNGGGEIDHSPLRLFFEEKEPRCSFEMYEQESEEVECKSSDDKEESGDEELFNFSKTLGQTHPER